MTDIVLNCCVVDDEPLARQLICSFIEKTPFLQLKGSFSSASEAVKCIVSGQMNLVFLDIQMPELDGLEFAKIIPPECRIIFVTAFEKYAIEGFRNNAIDYLLKPVSYNEFLSAANRALQWEKLKAKAETASPDENRFIIVKRLVGVTLFQSSDKCIPFAFFLLCISLFHYAKLFYLSTIAK